MSTRHRSTGVAPEQGATIVEALIANAARRPDEIAMRHLGNREVPGEWEAVSWREYLSAASEVAGGLAELGVAPGQHVAVLSANRVEWHLSDLGILLNGGVTVPIYPTSAPEQIAYILGDCGATACFVDSHAQLGKLVEVRGGLPLLRQIVLIEGTRRAGDGFVVSFDALRKAGADRLRRHRDVVEERSRNVRPEDTASVVYTSGASGAPKGVVVTHANIMWTLRQVTPVYGVGDGERLLSFLPLSHIAERMMSEMMPIAIRGETWFARSLATVPEDLPACRPTVFLAVPRIWEKLRESVERRIAGEPLPVRLAHERYVKLGLEQVAAQQQAASTPVAARTLYRGLDMTLGAATRRHLGLDEARVLITAAAPAHPELIKWFHAIGLPLLQLYGQTEGCGPTAGNPPGRIKIGTVGSVFPGMTVTIAPDKEILLKGGNVCGGYLNDPEATRELIDDEGWMHTGDMGVFDPDGSLRILGRKKDIIITAAGENIAPEAIESDLTNHPLISEAVVVGDGRRYLVALVTLDPEELGDWARSQHKLGSPEALSSETQLRAEIQAVIDRVNAKRSRAESIRKFRVLGRVLTSEDGELTATLKVRRSLVYERYGAVIDELYADT